MSLEDTSKLPVVACVSQDTLASGGRYLQMYESRKAQSFATIIVEML